MALILKQGFSIKDYNQKDYENCYLVIDQLNINKSSKECYFAIDIFSSKDARENKIYPILTIPYCVPKNEYDNFFSLKIVGEKGNQYCCAYDYLKSLKEYENWDSDIGEPS